MLPISAWLAVSLALGSPTPIAGPTTPEGGGRERLASTQEGTEPGAPRPGLAPEVVRRAVAAAATEEAVYVDRPGDGNVWAQGSGYKARFGPGGTTLYLPLSSPTPRLAPFGLAFVSSSLGSVRLDVPGTAEPSSEGLRVEYDRGGVREVYDLRVRELEQTLVVDSAPLEAGDLVVRMAVSGELSFAGSGPDGLRFETADGKSGVFVGHAVAIDAAGAQREALTAFDSGEIEIRVPAGSLAGAPFPLAIDPLLTPFGVDTTVDYTDNADIAYDVTNDVWCVVYELVTGGQGDIYSRLVSDPSDGS
ncbi:MAG TPA: hypothetical protein VKF62_03280, partial [Planctomycetota bacterium]|nr:hypothetical protein [Planctomycetota bacterium]